MANFAKQVPENVPGEFFVDSTCIDCDACRQIAPSVFAQADETSFVAHQPESPLERVAALHALLCCPTGSIGCLGDNDAKNAMLDFPLAVEDPVYYCGFNSPKSFGGNSYFIRHPDGNWLIDSPKFFKPLVRKIEELGGIQNIFLTHRDDVADASRFAKHFCAKRIIDRRELDAQPDAEIVIDGDERLSKLEIEAREAKRGLWAEANPLAPWEYRARQKKPETKEADPNALYWLTGLLDRLEKQGLVQRERCTEDRRVIYVEFTDSAKELLKRMDDPVNELHTQLIGHLTKPELKELSRLLEKARLSVQSNDD